ncbi:MAG: hypothetical protein V6Z82_06730 [Flavobacteriales bacterium]
MVVFLATLICHMMAVMVKSFHLHHGNHIVVVAAEVVMLQDNLKMMLHHPYRVYKHHQKGRVYQTHPWRSQEPHPRHLPPFRPLSSTAWLSVLNNSSPNSK